MRLSEKMASFARQPLVEKTQTLSGLYWGFKTRFYYRHFFRRIGSGSKIFKPLQLRHPEFIAIGVGVMINRHCWLNALPLLKPVPELIIGDGCAIGHFNHITCVERIHIEDKVLTADRVFISDHGHQYEDPSRPVMDQGVVSRGPVVIGQGSWLGENVAVISSRIGRHCVIGANSVVLNDIPDYSIAVGAPARVIRTFSPQRNAWEKVPLSAC